MIFRFPTTNTNPLFADLCNGSIFFDFINHDKEWQFEIKTLFKFFLLWGRKMDFFDPHGAIKSTL